MTKQEIEDPLAAIGRIIAEKDALIAEHQSLDGLQQMRIEQLEKALRDCVNSIVGYRNSLPHPHKQCDAERNARKVLGL